VGTSDLELEQDRQPGHYVYTWTITAHGIFRLYRAEVTQKSWLTIDAGHVRPEKYRAGDGSSTVNLDFDWESRHARGVSETKPVDLILEDGAQDVMSIQVEVMLDLEKGIFEGIGIDDVVLDARKPSVRLVHVHLGDARSMMLIRY